MQATTRVLHEPSHGFVQPPPLSFDDPFSTYHPGTSSSASASAVSAASSNIVQHPLAFDLQSPVTTNFGVPDLFPPPSFDSMNFFSSNEQDDMLDFLRDFDAADPWEFNPILPSSMPPYPGDTILEDLHRQQHHQYPPPQSIPGVPAPDHDQSGIADSASVASVHSSTPTVLPDSQTTPQAHRSSPPAAAIYQTSGTSYHHHNHSQQQAYASTSSGSSNGNGHSGLNQADYRPKPLLSGPQKRMNHVKSEKRRRDTIRDGYLTLTKLLSPSGPGAEQLAIPRRGRPKGSGRHGSGKKTGKGKSGVLFRAVEYIRFMEEGCTSLELECERLERMILTASSHSQTITNMQYGHSW